MSDAPLARHALITGGSSGLGLALAAELLKQGAAVTLLARDRARLSDAHAALSRDGAKIRALSCDVTDPAAMQDAAKEAERSLGPVDLAIACAGAARPGRFETLPEGVFADQMALNYGGSLNLARAVLPKMRSRGRGRLLLISSAAGLIGLPGHAAYAPSKFAVRGLAQALRFECLPDGVPVSCAFPPDIDTPGLAAEKPHTPPELSAISHRAGVMKPDRCARRILTGLARGRAEIHPSLAVRALARLAPLIQPLLLRRLDALAAAARAENDWMDRLPEPPAGTKKEGPKALPKPRG